MVGTASNTPPAGLGENKAIKFQIKTGGSTWQCTLQDRAQYERNKAKVESPTESSASSASSASAASPASTEPATNESTTSSSSASTNSS